MILCGIYGTVIAHINGFFKTKQQFIAGLIYLLPIAIGGVIGIFALSQLLELLIERYSLPTFALFAGMVLGSIPMVLSIIYKKRDAPAVEGEKSSPKWRTYLLHSIPVILACGVVVAFAFLNTSDRGVRELDVVTGIMLVVCGAVAAASLIFPGTSGALMLILLGYYNTIINAVTDINIAILGLVMLGAIIGFLASARFVGFLLRRYSLVTHLAIVGFLIGSVIGIFVYRGTYSSGTDAIGITLAVIYFFLGFSFTLILSRLQKNKRSL